MTKLIYEQSIPVLLQEMTVKDKLDIPAGNAGVAEEMIMLPKARNQQ